MAFVRSEKSDPVQKHLESFYSSLLTDVLFFFLFFSKTSASSRATRAGMNEHGVRERKNVVYINFLSPALELQTLKRK